MKRKVAISVFTAVCFVCLLACRSSNERKHESTQVSQAEITNQDADLGLVDSKAPSCWLAFEGDHGWGYRDPKGNVVIEPKFEMALDFVNAMIGFVFHEGDWACIDREGRILFCVLPFDNGPDPFADGLARCVDAGKIGFFDTDGRVVIPARFDFAFPFSQDRAVACEGCAPVPEGEHFRVEGGKWGYVDKKGAWIINPMYASCEPFENGMATVVLGGETFRIDLDGRRVNP